MPRASLCGHSNKSRRTYANVNSQHSIPSASCRCSLHRAPTPRGRINQRTPPTDSHAPAHDAEVAEVTELITMGTTAMIIDNAGGGGLGGEDDDNHLDWLQHGWLRRTGKQQLRK